jgi:lipoprotein-anchoring transpeptidase ErfK/SrfK
MPKFRFHFFGILSAVALVLAGCATDPRNNPETAYIGSMPKGTPGYDNVSYWDGDNVSGPASIKISLSEQRAYFYKGGQLVGISWISTGREGKNTTTGSFRITQKDKDHASSIYGDYVDAQGAIVKKDIEKGKDPVPPGAHFDGAKMPFAMHIVGGTWMHQGFLPGYPASHGCIRMPRFMAEAFFRNVAIGTPVTITQ